MLKSSSYAASCLAVLAICGGLSPDRANPEPQSSRPVTGSATVEISLVRVEPTDVSVNTNESVKRQVATVTVQLQHEPLLSTESVTLEVGTYTASPNGAATAVTYDPYVQTVEFSPGPQGMTVAHPIAVRALRADDLSDATIGITAVLRNPSSGLRIVHDDPDLSNHYATLSIRGQKRRRSHS